MGSHHKRLGMQEIELSMMVAAVVFGCKLDAYASAARTVTLLFLRWLRNCSYTDSSQVLVRLQEIVACALNDLEQIIHRRNLLELFGQEPLQKIDRDVIILFSRKLDEPVDLIGDVNLLVE